MLPWYLPEDLKHFKTMTINKSVVMGRKTWDSLNHEPLQGRKNIILSKQYGYSFMFPGKETYVYSNVLELIRMNKSLWVIGGFEIFEEFMPYADHIVKTEVNMLANGDVRAPGMFPPDWREVSNTGWMRSISNVEYRILEYIRND